MEDPYQTDTYAEEYYTPPEPRRGMSGWLIALIVVLALVVVCCLCACLVLVFASPAIGDVFTTVVETLEAVTPVP